MTGNYRGSSLAIFTSLKQQLQDKTLTEVQEDDQVPLQQKTTMSFLCSIFPCPGHDSLERDRRLDKKLANQKADIIGEIKNIDQSDHSLGFHVFEFHNHSTGAGIVGTIIGLAAFVGVCTLLYFLVRMCTRRCCPGLVARYRSRRDRLATRASTSPPTVSVIKTPRLQRLQQTWQGSLPRAQNLFSLADAPFQRLPTLPLPAVNRERLQRMAHIQALQQQLQEMPLMPPMHALEYIPNDTGRY